MSAECPRLILVSQYADDELAEPESSELIEHIKVCQQCSDELAAVIRVRKTLASMPVDGVARQRVFTSLAGRTQPVAKRTISVPLPVAAALLLMLAASVLGNAYLGVWRTQRQGASPEQQSEPVTSPSPARSRASGEPLASSRESPRQPRQATVAAKRAPKLSTVTFECDQQVSESVIESEYRLYPEPKIYAGGVYNPIQR